MPPSSFRCWAEIDRSVLENNVRAIRRHLPAGTAYISVVKADSYGLGAKRLVGAIKAGGANAFAVANVTEAAELRQIDPVTPILLLSATLPDEDDHLFEYNVTPTVSSVEEVLRYGAAAARHRRPLPVHLKFDTGMGRLGRWHDDADELIGAVAAAPLLQLRGIYSHFASAGEDADFTNLQRRRLLEAAERVQPPNEPLLLHIDNSAGLGSFPPEGPFNAVRIGLLQYGILPVADASLVGFGTTPAFSLHARVSVIKQLPKGAGVSYGSTHALTRPSRVAVVTAGYADGIIRACSNRGSVLLRGRRCPILGNVTMDGIVIDTTDLPEVACGDQVTFVGRQDDAEITIQEFSASCGTIPWESLCALGKRVARVYR